MLRASRIIPEQGAGTGSTVAYTEKGFQENLKVQSTFMTLWGRLSATLTFSQWLLLRCLTQVPAPRRALGCPPSTCSIPPPPPDPTHRWLHPASLFSSLQGPYPHRAVPGSLFLAVCLPQMANSALCPQRLEQRLAQGGCSIDILRRNAPLGDQGQHLSFTHSFIHSFLVLLCDLVQVT